MANTTIAATQMACVEDCETNIANAEEMVRRAAGMGAQIIVLQELFETPYFCKDQNADYFKLAHPYENNPLLKRMSDLAVELGVVLPISFFEQDENVHFNSLAVIDADGKSLGRYRKAHIPDGPGYQEKFYFTPGNMPFTVFRSRFGRIGAAVCWDQWFPEVARTLALGGADFLCYPTAIGSEPAPAPPINSSAHWRRVMQGHAAANMVPVLASNRIGHELGESADITFYGNSFIADETGEIVQSAGADDEAILVHQYDWDVIRQRRLSWGLFRDRRPDLYGEVLNFGGEG